MKGGVYRMLTKKQRRTVTLSACKQGRVKEPLPMQQSVQTDTVRKRPAETSAKMKAGASRSLFSWKHRRSTHGNVYTSAARSMRKLPSLPAVWGKN